MRNPSGQLILYSSLAIVLLVLMWGLREIPAQGRLADQALRESLNQEIIVLGGAVKSATNALKYRLLDVLKAEGNDHSTRTFQDSPFMAASLIEWDGAQWKPLWFSNKSKTDLQSGEMKTWLTDWPLSKLAIDEVYFTKVGDIEGQAYFAVLVPVRKPNQTPLVGVGIFPASQFGLGFSSDENREIRVFTASGSALALTHPAYLGANVKSEPIVREMLEGEEVSLRHEWKSDTGVRMIGASSRINDSNLYVAIETKAIRPAKLAAWAYLVLCALGAGLLNWVLFSSIFRTVIAQLSSSEELNEQLRKQLAEANGARGPVKAVAESPTPAGELAELDFLEAIAHAPLVRTPGQATPEQATPEPPPEPVNSAQPLPPTPIVAATPAEPEAAPMHVPLESIVSAAVRSFDKRVREVGIRVMQFGFDGLYHDGDSLQLQTAIEEVLKNAIEAMTESPERNLTVSGRRHGDRVRITVEDTGCGIPPDQLEKVFDPFFSTKSTEGVARGLGLNVVRRVVEELHGSVKIHSKPASGSRVEIELPALPGSEIALKSEDFAVADLPAVAFHEREYLNIPIRKPKVRTLD